MQAKAQITGPSNVQLPRLIYPQMYRLGLTMWRVTGQYSLPVYCYLLVD